MGTLLAIALLTSPVLAATDPALEARLEEVQALYNDLDYELALAKAAVARDDATSPEDRARALVWLGILNGELVRDEQARASFASALELAPEVTLPVKPSPKVRQLFSELSEAAAKKREAELAARPKPTPVPPAALPTPAAAQPPVPVHYLVPGALGAGAVVAEVVALILGAQSAAAAEEATKAQSFAAMDASLKGAAAGRTGATVLTVTAVGLVVSGAASWFLLKPAEASR